jgi:hypothetical protein
MDEDSRWRSANDTAIFAYSSASSQPGADISEFDLCVFKAAGMEPVATTERYGRSWSQRPRATSAFCRCIHRWFGGGDGISLSEKFVDHLSTLSTALLELAHLSVEAAGDTLCENGVVFKCLSRGRILKFLNKLSQHFIPLREIERWLNQL